jgi:hypothetical protein
MTRLLCLLLAALPLVAEARTPRDRAELRAFRSDNPCPATGLVGGACPGYRVDYMVALCAGGLDKQENMYWLTIGDHKWKKAVDERECKKGRRILP